MKKISFLVWAGLCLLAFNALSQNKMTPELMWKMGRLNDLQLSPDASTLLYGVTHYQLESNNGNRDLYVLPAVGGEAVRLTTYEGPDFNAVWRPDGKKIGFISYSGGDGQIWEMNPDGSGKRQVSKIAGGVQGFQYAPDMKHIMYVQDVKTDQTVQDRYPDLPKADAMIIDDLMYRHWDSWHDYAYSHIFIAPYTDGNVGEGIDIMKDEPFDSPLMPYGGMEQISWSPDGKSLAYTCKKLKGLDYAISTNSDIYIYDLDNGQTVNVSEENQGYDMDPAFSPDGSYLVWCSMQTPGFEADKNRIILYDRAGKKTRDLSSGFDQSASSLKWHPTEKDLLYFISGIKATYQLYQVNISSGVIRQLTSGAHDYTELVVGADFLAGVKMSLSMPSEIFRVNVPKSGYSNEKQLSFVNRELLSSITMGKVEERWITTTDQKKMLVWVMYPPDFDKNKKYPALLYCQGGPQSAVSQFWSYRWNLQMMAANGYIVVAPNRRGLPTFGQEWNDQISGDYGGQNMKDYLVAIDSVSTDPWVDKNHLGAVGASYGGFSVYWLAGNHNGRFRAFIAHCGMFNLESWYGSTEEYWFPDYDLGGEYWKKTVPESYGFSPHRFVGNWDTPILVIHGGKDFRIPYTEGMQAFNAAQIKGVPSRFLYFPNETHFVTKPQNAVLWQREFFRWLDQWLKE